MKIIVRLDVEVDETSWTDAYGTFATKAALRADVNEYVRNAAEDQIQTAVDGNARVTVR